MTHDSPDVKGPKSPCGWWRYRTGKCIAWIDKHPRLGWYLFALNFLNVVLNLLDLFH